MTGPRPDARRGMSDDEFYDRAGRWLGVPAGVAVFLAAWGAAVSGWGWLVGLVVGWIPAALAGAVVGALVRFLWPFLILGALVLYRMQRW